MESQANAALTDWFQLLSSLQMSSLAVDVSSLCGLPADLSNSAWSAAGLR